MSASLYIVIFDDGTTKVGGCTSPSPKLRIRSHIGVGKAFGRTCIYHGYFLVPGCMYVTEGQLCLRISRHAKLIQGKEWFKFENGKAALEYANEKFERDCLLPYGVYEP